MAFETVTGYCWPQSVDGGEHGRAAPVVRRAAARCRSRWPGSAAERTVVFADDAVPADDHATPRDAAQRRAAAGRPAARARRRPGVALGLLRGRPRDRRRRQAPPQPRLLRRPARRSARRPRRSCWRWPPTPGTPTTTSAAATSTPAAPTVSLQRPMSPGLPVQAAGRSAAGSPSLHPPDPQMAAHVGYLPLNHLSPWAGSAGWPDWELPFLQWAEGDGLRRSTSSPTPTSRTTPTCSARAAGVLAVPLGRPRRVLVGADARHRRGLHRPAAATPPSSPATRRSGRCASRTRRPRVRPPRWSATRASSSRTRCTTPTASASSPASGPTTSSGGPRTT